MTPESWRPAAEFNDIYEVSDLGRVRRVARGKGAVPGRILRPLWTRKGYLRVALMRDGERSYIAIHRLVLGSFAGPPMAGQQCNHRDGDKTNNALRNLEWVTPSENIKHAVRTGLLVGQRGTANGRAKLTDCAVERIRSAPKSVGNRALARQLGVSRSAVQQARAGVTWKHRP